MAQPKTTKEQEPFDLQKIKTEAKAKQNAGKKTIGSIIISIVMLLVVISIAYSTYRILTGTDDLVAWIMLIPQALYASFVLVKQFIK